MTHVIPAFGARPRRLLLALALAALPGWAAPALAGDAGEEVIYVEKGEASYYGPGFHGKETASGETFNQNDLTAAHRKLPLGTKAKVTNLENGKSVKVEVNDRGPYAKGRVIDLSKAAAKKIGVDDEGTAKVKIEATKDAIEEGKSDGVGGKGK